MAQDVAKIRDTGNLLARIAAMRADEQALSTSIRTQCVRAVVELGALRQDVAAAAHISRVTLNAWIDNPRQDQS